MYNWHLPAWPHFTYDRKVVKEWISAYETNLAEYLRAAETIPDPELQSVYVATVVEEGVQSSSIEGEIIKRADVQSSLTNNLRFGPAGVNVADFRARGIADLMRAVLQDVEEPLTETRIKYWHETMFQGQRYPGIKGTYRDSQEPMRIVSSSLLSPTVHYEAPPSVLVPELMQGFIAGQRTAIPAVLRAGIDHVHFESIHPFADGNGRIGRAIMERTLLQPIGGRPLLSISHAIRLERDGYYAALQQAQTGLDLTHWLDFYFMVLNISIELGRELTAFTFRKIHYFEQFGPDLNASQEKAILKMWAAGPTGFQGGMTAKKYSRITRLSPATATRDLAYLTKIGALIRQGGGRSTHYVLPG